MNEKDTLGHGNSQSYMIDRVVVVVLAVLCERKMPLKQANWVVVIPETRQKQRCNVDYITHKALSLPLPLTIRHFIHCFLLS